MGCVTLEALREDLNEVDVVLLVRDSEANRKKMQPYMDTKGIQIVWGDLTEYGPIKECVKDTDVVLHVGALVSPTADYKPKLAMETNYGSCMHIVNAVKELGQQEKTRVVYIGTVAETGDRMPPIHWGRVGDPIKPSVFDYYAVSKIAAERCIIESDLPYWASLRQTGILGPNMSGTDDPIMFHNCLDNVLEYVSDRDSATMLQNLCRKERRGELGDEFWGHVFNIGGGESCRGSAYNFYTKSMNAIGLKKLDDVAESKWFATRNFHGQYYLDSDKLEKILNFRHDSLAYFFDNVGKVLGGMAVAAKTISKIPGGQKLLQIVIKKRFLKAASADHGTVKFINDNMEDHIAAYWGSKEAFNAVPSFSEFKHFTDWKTVVRIDHGYDETKPENTLSLADMQGASKFRGGQCLSTAMATGDWRTKLRYKCAFGHEFDASPRLVLEGGHWCPVCERESWNYYERAKVDPFFNQIWAPLHPADEKAWKYPKNVSELDVSK